MKKWLAFWNDEDGFSAKDYLMVMFSTIFCAFLVVAFVTALTGTLPATAIAVIQMMDGIMIAIVTGVFGLQGIKEFKKTTSTQMPYNFHEPTYNENAKGEYQKNADVSSDTQQRLP
ncbi:hypothetical protein [Brevibacillus laterosporus]|uniref:hypothetical protein n=1 Tax=Brevibacillus laterosporus TaxID=1465 RepID=UPI003D1FA4FF